MAKVIICAALTGGLQSKQAHPGLPEQPAEIAAAAHACWQAGAAIVHLHARDARGAASADPEIFRDINAQVRARCDVIINNTTGVGPGSDPAARFRVLEAGAEMASLNMGTMVRTRYAPGSVFLNTRQQIEEFAAAMRARGIRPEFEIYNHAMFVEVENLVRCDLVTEPLWINLVLGMSHMGALRGRSRDLLSLVEYLPAGALWCATAVGASQLPLTTMAMLLGGHVRVGLEDNLYYARGELARDNAQLVERAVRIARELQFEVATPAEARAIIGLAPLAARNA